MKIIAFNHSVLFPIIVSLLFIYSVSNVSAQESTSVLYVPLIGITSVPQPLALPDGEGTVTYRYAVKNFLREVPLTNISVVDDMCSTIRFVEGDDNRDTKLDYSETWRYTCSTKLSKTTKSTATATGTANSITATHKAYATVLVGSENPPPLVSIVNTTKVSYPLPLPSDITFSYKVTNPGLVALSDVTITDNLCTAMSGKLGDTNSNNLLDTYEVWIYTCPLTLTETSTDIVTVTANANGLKAVDQATLTINGNTANASPPPLFDVGISPLIGGGNNFKLIVWGILSGVLALLILSFVLRRKST